MNDNANPLRDNRDLFQLRPTKIPSTARQMPTSPPAFENLPSSAPGYEGIVYSPNFVKEYYALNKPIIWTLESYQRLDDASIYTAVFSRAPREIYLSNFGPGTMVFTFNGDLADIITFTSPNNNFLTTAQQKVIYPGTNRAFTNLRLRMINFGAPGGIAYQGPVWVFSCAVDTANNLSSFEFRFTEIAAQLNSGEAPV